MKSDQEWMRYALLLAQKAEALGEVPVGAVLVDEGGNLLAEGFNQNIARHDPSAHAEIVALRQAGQYLENYRLSNATLYVTLEPCPMCAGAMVHARVGRLVFGAADPRTGAAGSVFQLADSEHLNHRMQITSGILAAECSSLLRMFFRTKREALKARKLAAVEQQPSDMV